MRVFVINLDRRPDRLAQISDLLGGLGIAFERISAVDGRATDTGVHTRSLISWLYEGCRRPSPGAIACYLSHASVWRRIADEGISQALVFEDDATIHDWDIKLLDLRIADHGIDLLRIGGNEPPAVTLGAIVVAGVGGRAMLRDAARPRGTCAYFITNEGAKKCLAYKRYWFPIDNFELWSSLYRLSTGVLSPLAFVPSASPSDIKTDSTHALADRLLQRLRSAMRRSIVSAVDLRHVCLHTIPSLFTTLRGPG